MKILIVKVSALGDVIHALPVLSYIKQIHPDAHIDWLVEDNFAPILENHPFLHQVIRVNTHEWRNMSFAAMARQICTFVKSLRCQHYDCIFDLQGNRMAQCICDPTPYPTWPQGSTCRQARTCRSACSPPWWE
ncbi:MAG: hypothetical protein LC645_03620 [Geobacteraceae bacterium]|nr:hypothetical protein [Geobacteraceae bacterium]